MDAALDPSFAEQFLSDYENNTTDSSAQENQDQDDIDRDTEQGEDKSGLYQAEDSKSTINFKAKKGPTAIIFTIILSLFGVGFGAGFSFPFAFAARVSEEFNSIAPSSSARGKSFMLRLFANGYKKNRPKSADSIADNITSDKQFTLSNKQKKKLAKYDIDYDSDTKSLKYKGESITAENLKAKLDADADFRTKFTDAGQTWKGKASGWFDRTVDKVLNRLGVKSLRNKFKNFVDTGDKAKNTEAFRKTAPSSSNTPESEALIAREEIDENTKKPKVDKDGKPVKVAETDIDSKSITTKKLTDRFQSAAALAGIGASAYCAVTFGANAIQLLAAANQSREIINLTAGLLEAGDKTMAGEGSTSPLLNYMEDLTTPDKDGKTALESYGIHSLFSGGGSDFRQPEEGKPDSRRSNGFLSANRESIINAIPLVGDYANTAQAVRDCANAKTGAAVFSIVATLAGFFTAGTTTIAAAASKAAKKAVLPILASVGLGIAMNIAVETISQRYMSKLNFLGDAGGNALGSGANMYPSENAKGGGQSPGSTEKVLAYRREVLAEYQAETRAHDIASKSPFDLSSPYTFAGVVARNLATFSLNNSKLTNSFARIGSMTVNSITAILPSANAIAETNFLTTKGYCPMLEGIGVHADPYCNPYYITDTSTIGKEYSPKDIFDKVYDARLITTTDNTRTFCPTWHYSSNFLYEANTKNPVKEDLDLNSCKIKPKINEDNNPVINPSSYLGGYIRFCGHRGSQLGVNDANVLSWTKNIDFDAGSHSITSEVISNASANPIIGAIPLVGDIVDLVDANNISDEALKFSVGQFCVANPETNPKWETDFKFYQRYIEDQRWMENAGIISKSAADIVMDNQLAMQPLDNSYEGILARYSGMTKETVVATLDHIEYLKYIAKYDPTTRSAPINYPASAISYVKSDKSQNHELTGENTLAHAIENTKTTPISLTKKTRYAIIV